MPATFKIALLFLLCCIDISYSQTTQPANVEVNRIQRDLQSSIVELDRKYQSTVDAAKREHDGSVKEAIQVARQKAKQLLSQMMKNEDLKGANTVSQYIDNLIKRDKPEIKEETSSIKDSDAETARKKAEQTLGKIYGVRFEAPFDANPAWIRFEKDGSVTRSYGGEDKKWKITNDGKILAEVSGANYFGECIFSEDLKTVRYRSWSGDLTEQRKRLDP